ncbi:MAG: excinuclease ABC subunit UvrC [Pseudomonadota bacterium]
MKAPADRTKRPDDDVLRLPKSGKGISQHADLKTGIRAIRNAAKAMPSGPGVYHMIDQSGDVIYVGKARNLKSRVTSYTHPNRLTARLMRMVAETRSMTVVTTHTEAEALLLEANLIKKHRTRFNVLLRDDKSFPYILLRQDTDWPQLYKHRGAQRRPGRYYGPFASAGAVERTLNSLQRVFLLRSCKDSVFNNRTRPCLLYQIKRCSAPCVGRIDQDGYAKLVADAQDFLEGKSSTIQKNLSEEMHQAADALDFEKAAGLRDRLRALAHIQSHQTVHSGDIEDVDVIALARKGGVTCIQVFFYRNGQNWGHRAFFPRHQKDDPDTVILSAFLAQFYENKEPPRSVFLSHDLPDAELLEEALTAKASRKVRVLAPQRGAKKGLLESASKNAQDALDRRLAETGTQAKLLRTLAEIFELDEVPQRIEVYDNSHIMGTNAVGAMIVAGPEGFMKNAYRKFNIKSEDLTPGDDFGMMREVMTRRFGRMLKEDPDNKKGQWPDLLLIDGGKGQLSSVLAIMEDLGLDEEIPLVAISKGPDRNAGREEFHRPGQPSMMLEPGSGALYFLQRLRDEAHRFAIGSHKARRAKTMKTSSLDDVQGVGPTRKRALLSHFGTAKAVSRAGLKDLEAVDGISKKVAQIIYDHYHDA